MTPDLLTYTQKIASNMLHLWRHLLHCLFPTLPWKQARVLPFASLFYPPTNSCSLLAAWKDLALLMQLPAALCLAKLGSDTLLCCQGPCFAPAVPLFFSPATHVTPTVRNRGEINRQHPCFYPWVHWKLLSTWHNCELLSIGRRVWANQYNLFCTLEQNESCYLVSWVLSQNRHHSLSRVITGWSHLLPVHRAA